MKRFLGSIAQDLKEAAEPLMKIANRNVTEKVTIGDVELTVNRGLVKGGDYDGLNITAATQIVPLAKDEDGNWLVEAMVMPLIEKHMVFSVDGSLSRMDAFEKVEEFLVSRDIKTDGSVQGMFDELVVNDGENKFKTVSETEAIIGYCSADIYTGFSGGVNGDVYSTEFYDDKWKDASAEYFTIDWSAAEEN